MKGQYNSSSENLEYFIQNFIALFSNISAHLTANVILHVNPSCNVMQLNVLSLTVTLSTGEEELLSGHIDMHSP